MNIQKAFSIVAIGCLLATGTAVAGTGARYGSAPSRLVIYRAANFGTFVSINVYIDGVLAGNIPYHSNYDALLPPGDHVVALEQTPRRGAAFVISKQRINLAPGGTSVFTAVTTDGGTRAVLDPS
jgi:hypothetical protein